MFLLCPATQTGGWPYSGEVILVEWGWLMGQTNHLQVPNVRVGDACTGGLITVGVVTGKQKHHRRLERRGTIPRHSSCAALA